MNSYLSLSWKEIKSQRLTSLLILIAVIMSTVMTSVVGQSVGILRSMRISQAAGLNGNRYATFHQLNEEQAERLGEDDRLTGVGEVIFIGSTDLGGLTLSLREYRGRALENYPALEKLKSGRLPEKANEIALPEDALKYLGLDALPGDRIKLGLRASVIDGSLGDYDLEAELLLTGILENSYLGYSSGSIDGVAGEGTSAILPAEYVKISTDFRTKNGIDFQSTVDSLAAELGVGENYIQYNWLLLDALGIKYNGDEGESQSGFSFMTAAFILVGGLVLLAAGLVIYNILKISISKRIKEYGTLRAIGGERRQIFALVSIQLLILCGVGIPLGLLLGSLAAKSALIAAAGLFNPDLFGTSASGLSAAISESHIEPLMLILSAAVTLIFALLAALPAASYASRVSPTVAMSGSPAKFRRKIKKRSKIHSFEAYYAVLNLKRGGARTIVTILSLVMSVTVFVALQSFTGLLDAGSSIKELYNGDYSITNETAGIPSGFVEKLRADEAIEKVAATRLKLFMPGEVPFAMNIKLESHETLQIVSIDSARLKKLAGLTDSDIAAIESGVGCVVKNPIAISFDGEDHAYTSLKIGDTIELDGRELRVVGVSDDPVTIRSGGFTNGLQVMASDEVYRALIDDSYAEICPTLKAGADSEAFEKRLDELVGEYAGTHWLSYIRSGEELTESFGQIKTLCQALIIFIGVIGILNIINTVYSNIHTRTSEIGTQRAIGMSVGSLFRTFMWEGVYYGIIASVVGSALGYICCIFIGAAKSDVLELVAVPVLPMLEASVVSVIVCLIATALPLIPMARMSIVGAIETGE